MILPIEGTYAHTENLPYGIQDILCELNDAGVPVSVLPLGSVYGRELIDTGFKLYAGDGYAVEEELTIAGETNVWAWTSEGAVFRDGLPYNYYDVPADGTPLRLGTTTLDGRSVTYRGNTKVWTYIPKQYTTNNARAGSPLEDHTRWYQKSTASSASGWDDFGYKIIVKPNTDVVRNIALGDETEAYQYEQAIFNSNNGSKSYGRR